MDVPNDAVAPLVEELRTLFRLVALAFGTTLAGALLALFNNLKARVLERKLDKNTEITQHVMPEVNRKVDSATLEAKVASQEAKLEATAAKQEAKDATVRVAIKQELSNEKVISTVKELTTSIKGTDGTCLTARLVKLEEAVIELREGHTEIQTGQKEMRDDLKRVLAFAEKQSKY